MNSSAPSRQILDKAVVDRIEEVCRSVAPEAQVTVQVVVDIGLAWQGHERHISLRGDEAADLRADTDPLRRRVAAVMSEIRTLTPVASVDEAARLTDQEALDRTIELARHMIGLLEPEATTSFEVYEWHGEPTLDITVALHGRQQHLEVSASRAHIILPDYEWELSRNDIEDEVLYHDLEELIHDLRHAG